MHSIVTSEGDLGTTRFAVQDRYHAELPPEWQDRIAVVARRLLEAEPRLPDIGHFGPGVRVGTGPGPAILFGDNREIPLLAEAGAVRYDYRLGWLARDGDLVVVGRPRSPSFEAYQRATLGQPGIGYFRAEPTQGPTILPTPRLCLQDGQCHGSLVSWASRADSVTLLPHICTGTIWALGARLHEETGKVVHVAGPPPLLSRRVNDKLWFGRAAASLFGETAIPPKRAAYCGAALTRHVAELARQWDRIVLKVPDSAGSRGNVVIPTAMLRGRRPRDLYTLLRSIAPGHNGEMRFPVAVEVWDSDVLTSPSVQIWIPLPDTGPPVIEGLYEQSLAGDEHAFAGATVARLSDDLNRRLCEGGLALALLFQELGYYGRCSFDATVVAHPDGRPVIHWIECNGRWGGVSIPMTLLNRLGRSGGFHAIAQAEAGPFPPRSFGEVVGSLAAVLPAEGGPGGVVFVGPDMIEAGTGIQMAVFGESAENVSGLADRIITSLETRGADGAADRVIPA